MRVQTDLGRACAQTLKEGVLRDEPLDGNDNNFV
jgi:hypothetical protein